MKSVLCFLKRVYGFVLRKVYLVWDSRLRSTIKVKEFGKEIFKIYDFGEVTRMRANTFEIKEPETIKWIKEFSTKDCLLDIGANIGIYSLFAAYRGVKVFAIEPDSLNYALLNLNIRLNNFGENITPYSLAIHNENKFSKFNISSLEWGGAHNSFDNTMDYKGKEYNPIHFQGTYGICLDSFLDNVGFIPNHLKIDVDGNENLVLKGAKRLLLSKILKSILIEFDIKKRL